MDKEGALPFQDVVGPWLLACFGAQVASSKTIRAQRFLEEALETVQAGGLSREEAHALVDYTFDRPVGELRQEVGGALLTLAGLCIAHGVNMDGAGRSELRRCWENIAKIRAKQEAKPVFSALPAGPIPCPYPEMDGMDVWGKPLGVGTVGLGKLRWNAHAGHWETLASVGASIYAPRSDSHHG